MSQLWALTRMEALRTLRTGEVYRYLLLPALLGPPVTVYAGVGIVSMRQSTAVVAVPPDLPEALDLERRLEEARMEVRVRADPLAAWEEGEVDAAVVSWREGDGIAGATSLEVAVPERWTMEIVADTRPTEKALRRVVRSAGDDVLADLVAVSGADPDRVLRVAEVDTLSATQPRLPFDPRRGLVAYAIFMGGMIAYFLLALPVVADRREGVTETLRAMPVSPLLVLLARLLAMVGLQTVAAVLLGGNLALLLLAVPSSSLPLPSLVTVPGVMAGVLAADAVYLAVGVLSPTTKAAANGCSLAMLVQMGLLGAGVFADVPAWVPLVGVVTAGDDGERLVAAWSCLVVTFALLWACGRLIERRADLVLSRGAE